MNDKILSFYTQHSPLTDPGQHANLYDDLPDDIPSLVKVVQGLLIPPYHHILALHKLWPQDIQNAGFGIRRMEDTITRLHSIHDAPLQEPRPASQRLGVNCRNFATLLVSILRHKNIPARVRVGFAGYLGGKLNYEHRITEYWDTSTQRWILVDAWIDELQKKARRLQFDALDIQADDPFYLSGDVWQKTRQNKLNPAQFGDSDTEIGMPMIRYALLHDFDALNKLEVLGCDAWGILSEKDEASLMARELDYLDQVATFTADIDQYFAQLLDLHLNTTYGQEVRQKAHTLGLAEG